MEDCSQGGQQSLALLAYVALKLSGHQGPENALRPGGMGLAVGRVLQWNGWRVNKGGAQSVCCKTAQSMIVKLGTHD